MTPSTSLSHLLRSIQAGYVNASEVCSEDLLLDLEWVKKTKQKTTGTKTYPELTPTATRENIRKTKWYLIFSSKGEIYSWSVYSTSFVPLAAMTVLLCGKHHHGLQFAHMKVPPISFQVTKIHWFADGWKR